MKTLRAKVGLTLALFALCAVSALATTTPTASNTKGAYWKGLGGFAPVLTLQTLNSTGSTKVLSIRNSAATEQASITAAGTITTVGNVVANRHLSAGTTLTTADIAISGWGASATKAITGTDSAGVVTITTNASDTPSASPTVALTFHDGTWTTAPFAVTTINSASGGTVGPFQMWLAATTAAACTFTYNGTPTAVAAKTYSFFYVIRQ